MHLGRTLPTTAAIAALTIGVGIGAAWSRNATKADLTQLPVTEGTVKQFTLTPRGDIDGLILNDGTEVNLPPHLTDQVLAGIKPGDKVSVRGLRALALPLVDASSVTDETTGATIVDRGPAAAAEAEPVHSARVKMPLRGPRGEVNGALLQDGAILRLPPPEAERYAALFQPGATLFYRGDDRKMAYGEVIQAQAIGASADRLDLIGPPPPPPGGRMPPPPPPGTGAPPPPAKPGVPG